MRQCLCRAGLDRHRDAAGGTLAIMFLLATSGPDRPPSAAAANLGLLKFQSPVSFLFRSHSHIYQREPLAVGEPSYYYTAADPKHHCVRLLGCGWNLAFGHLDCNALIDMVFSREQPGFYPSCS